MTKFAHYTGLHCLLARVDFLGRVSASDTCIARPGGTIRFMPRDGNGDGPSRQAIINGGTVSFADQEEDIGPRFARIFGARYFPDRALYDDAIAKAVDQGKTLAAEFEAIPARDWAAFANFAHRHAIPHGLVIDAAIEAGRLTDDD